MSPPLNLHLALSGMISSSSPVGGNLLAEPFMEPETVPSLAWATPDQYPVSMAMEQVGVTDLLAMLGAWGTC